MRPLRAVQRAGNVVGDMKKQPQDLVRPVRQEAQPSAETRPEWADARGIHHRFGIAKSTLYRLASEGKIRAVSLKERGKLRGKKLYSCDSIAAFIESMEKGGGE